MVEHSVTARFNRDRLSGHKIFFIMRNQVRLNKEINLSVMPKGWKGCKENKISCLTLYLTKEERKRIMLKFSLYRNKVYKAEVMCYLLSNYVAYLCGKPCESIAMKVWKYGRKYNTPDGYVYYSIGAIPIELINVVHRNIDKSDFRFRVEMYYHAVTAFYNAPDKLLDEMCRRIESMKNPKTRNDECVRLQTVIPEKEYQMIKGYAIQNGMNVCDLMRVVLRSVCVSKKERELDGSMIGKVFSLYRLIKQPAYPFVVDSNSRVLFVEVAGESEMYYLMKFMKRRGISKTEMLRKAVRALDDVISHKKRIEKNITIEPESSDEDEGDYWYNKMARNDFARSIYI